MRTAHFLHHIILLKKEYYQIIETRTSLHHNSVKNMICNRFSRFQFQSNSHIAWNFGGSFTALNTNTSYPANWSEIMVIAGNSSRYTTVNMLKAMIPSDGISIRGGFYESSSDYLHLSVNFQASQFKITKCKTNGGDSITIADWYYKI